MNKIFRFFGIAAAALSLASCLKTEYVWESYVSVDSASLTVKEDCGTVALTLSSHNLGSASTTVTLKLVDATAKAGQDIDFAGSPTVTFNGDETKDVVLNVVNHPGVYTGTVFCYVEVVSATDAKVGSFNSARIVIEDLDHPLADVLGVYTLTPDSGYRNPKWSVTIDPDPKNTSKVIVYNLEGYMTSKIPYSGTVSADHKTISIDLNNPFSSSGYDVMVQAMNDDGDEQDWSTVPTLDFVKQDDGTFVCEWGLFTGAYSGGEYAGYFNYSWGPLVLSK